MNMVEAISNKYMIINYIIVVAKILFKAIYSLIHYSWQFILVLEHIIRAEVDTTENELPLISEDNSEVSEGEDTTDVSKVQDQFEKNIFPQQVAITSTSEGTEVRLRSVVNSDNMADHCQVCGVKSATLRCKGPRCYKFFCLSCDGLYHQHPRRESHLRYNIGAYIPTVKIPPLSEEVENSFANKKQNITPEVVAQTPPVENFCNNVVSAEDEMFDDKASSSMSWHCTYCTVLNEISVTICQVCCRTKENLIPLNKNAHEILEQESLKQPPVKTLTNLTKPNTNEENANNNELYDKYWKKNSSESNSQPASENSSNFDVQKRYQTRSTRGHGEHPQNTATKSRNENTSTRPQGELNEEGIASGSTKTFSDTIPLIDDTSSIWECTFCTLKNQSTVNICQACGKSNVNKLLNEDNNIEIGQSKNISKEDQRSDLATYEDVAASCNSNTDVVALQFMEAHSLDNYEIAKLASILVNRNFRLQDAIEAAKNCSTLEESLAYLEQDCLMCEIKCNKRQMIQMLHCTHALCENCTRIYFTTQIRTCDITSFVCPFCKTPKQQRIEIFDDAISEYFSNLSVLLKPIIDHDALEIYQLKLRDWFLKINPNFIHCPNCPYAGLMDDNEILINCPECNITSCRQCKKRWYQYHEGKSCEQLAAWEQAPKNKKSNKKKEQPQEKNQDNNKIFFGFFSKGSQKKSDKETAPEQRNDTYSSVANSSKASKAKENHRVAERHDNNNYKYNSSEYPVTRPQSQENTPTRPGNNASTGAISKIKNDHERNFNNADTRTWDCTYCTRINDAFVQICPTCNKTNFRKFESNRVEDLRLASSQHDHIQFNSNNVSGFNTNTLEENLARVHNFNETSYDAKGLGTLIKDISISSDRPSTINSTMQEIPAQSAMDWQQSIGPNPTIDLYKKRGDEFTRKWDLNKEAMMHGFGLDELEIAIVYCNDNNPIEWLKNQWQRDIIYVKFAAAHELNNFGDINLMNISPVTDIQAKNALKNCFGDCAEAVKECVASNLRKLQELQLMGALSPDTRLMLSERNLSNIDVGSSTNQAIYPNQAMVPGSTIYNPPPANEIIYSHQELRNAGFSTSNILPNNTNYDSIIQSQLSRLDAAVEHSANILRQSARFTTIQKSNCD